MNATAIANVATDVLLLEQLLRAMRKVNLSATFLAALRTHSAHYKGYFQHGREIRSSNW